MKKLNKGGENIMPKQLYHIWALDTNKWLAEVEGDLIIEAMKKEFPHADMTMVNDVAEFVFYRIEDIAKCEEILQFYLIKDAAMEQASKKLGYAPFVDKDGNLLKT